MKKLLIIILVLISINSFAQQNYISKRQQRKNNWIRLGLFVSSIGLDAAGDACNNNNNKDIGHLLEVASVGATLAIPLLVDVDKSNWYWYLLEYTFLRFSTFDYVYNAAAGNDFNYNGTSNIYDRVLKKQNQVIIPKIVCFSIGIIINFKCLNK